MRYLVPALHDLGDMLKGRRLAPVELFDAARKSLHFVGYEGLSMIAASGLDMAAWDALAKAAGQPLCVLLGGSVGPGEGLQQQRAVAAASRRRSPRRRSSCATKAASPASSCGSAASALRDDLATLDAVRKAVGDDMHLMVDFNQGLTSPRRCSAATLIDDLGLAWIEEPIVYDNLDGYAQLARRTEDADPDRRELLRPARPAQGAADARPATS